MPSSPLFIHSSFRSSSTWLWEKFRRCDNALAFYEPFNELLATITTEAIDTISPNRWNSGHPQTEPYFVEYRPLLDEVKGIIFFQSSFAFERFFPEDGLCGDIDSNQITYIQNLLNLAEANGKVPVLACTRTLGRMTGLRRSFGGTHVFLHRSLYDQWMSYLFHYERGNSYFIDATIKALQFGQHIPVFQRLLELCLTETVEKFSVTKDAISTFYPFLGLHLLLYIRARRHSDITIDTTELADRGTYANEIEREIEDKAGLRISLADVKREVQHCSFQFDRAKIEKVVDIVTQDMSAGDRDYANSLTSKFLSDSSLASAIATPLLKAADSSISQLNVKNATYQDEIQALQIRLFEFEKQVYELKNGQEVDKQEKSQLRIKANAVEQQLEAEVTLRRNLESEISELLESNSWKITASLRKCSTIFDRFIIFLSRNISK